jgi:hypothetical protein
MVAESDIAHHINVANIGTTVSTLDLTHIRAVSPATS